MTSCYACAVSLMEALTQAIKWYMRTRIAAHTERLPNHNLPTEVLHQNIMKTTTQAAKNAHIREGSVKHRQPLQPFTKPSQRTCQANRSEALWDSRWTKLWMSLTKHRCNEMTCFDNVSRCYTKTSEIETPWTINAFDSATIAILSVSHNTDLSCCSKLCCDCFLPQSCRKIMWSDHVLRTHVQVTRTRPTNTHTHVCSHTPPQRNHTHNKKPGHANTREHTHTHTHTHTQTQTHTCNILSVHKCTHRYGHARMRRQNNHTQIHVQMQICPRSNTSKETCCDRPTANTTNAYRRTLSNENRRACVEQKTCALSSTCSARMRRANHSHKSWGSDSRHFLLARAPVVLLSFLLSLK